MMPRHHFLGPDTLLHLTRADSDDIRQSAVRSIAATREMLGRSEREGQGPFRGGAALAGSKDRQIFDMSGSEDPLPGQMARGESDPDHADELVNVAYANSGKAYDFVREVMGRRSFDDNEYPVRSSVRFGKDIANALWEGKTMVFGDGIPGVFRPFVHALDVVAHEFAHGILAFSSNLEMRNESGALAESFCDVMGIMTRQWAEGRDGTDPGDWLIGRDLLDPRLGVPGVRSFAPEPAFADHPLLGDDVQPKRLGGFVSTVEDRGGVHANSGIINHVFYRAVRNIGGNSWETVGKLWFEAFIGFPSPATTFGEAAEAMVVLAERRHGAGPVLEGMKDAWAGVGILRAG